MRRVTMAAALAVVLAMVAAGCGNKADTSGGGGGQAANWPQRDLRIMAPAAPGGGWDTTARAYQPGDRATQGSTRASRSSTSRARAARSGSRSSSPRARAIHTS